MAIRVSTRLRLTACEVDLVLREVHGGRPSVLTPHEAALLRYLAERPEEPVSRERLLVDVWGYREGVDSPTVFNTMRRLREKVEADPSRPDHLLTVRGSGYRFHPLDERARAPRHGLLGRGADLAAVRAALRPGRVVTLLGPGGIGKTALARAVAAGWPGDVRVCERAEPANLDGLLSALASATGADRPETAAVLGALHGLRHPLLVLDDLDDTVEAAAPIVAALAARTAVLATSRSPLRIAAEQEVQLGPLDEASAVALLRARAPRVLPPSDDGALARLAALLEGVPLALELAAGGMRVLAPAELAVRLEAGQPLRSDRRDLPDRHSSLERAIEGSYRALDTEDREAFELCGLFRGTFDLPAAEAVLGPSAAERLHRQQARSLLRVLTDEHGTRYAMFRSVSAFARAHLPPERQEAAAARLAAHLRARAATLERTAATDVSARRQLAACSDLAETVLGLYDGPEVTDIVLALRSVLVERHPASVRVRWLDRAVAASVDDAQRVRARIARAEAAYAAGDLDAAEADLGVVESLPRTDADRALVHNTRGLLWYARGEHGRALREYRAARALHERLGDNRSVGSTDGRIALVLAVQGEREGALAHFDRALAVHRAEGNVVNEANVLVNRAKVRGTWTDDDLADLLRARDLATGAGSRRVEANALSALVRCRRARGEDDAADAALDLARAAFMALGWPLADLPP